MLRESAMYVYYGMLDINPLLPDGNKGHTYLNKPAAKCHKFV